MAGDFLNLKTDQKKLSLLILCVGGLLTILMAVKAFGGTTLTNGYEISKNEAGEGSFEQELIAYIGDEKFSINVEVGEKVFSETEAKKRLLEASKALDGILKAENQSLDQITTDICFADVLEDFCVEVTWTNQLPEYFYSDGQIREDLELAEPVEQKVTAILNCQKYTMDYEAKVVILPRIPSVGLKLLESIENDSKESSSVLKLPKEYENQKILWKKPLDYTFVYFGILTVAAVVFLQAGSKRDAVIKKRERQDALEKDYAQIVSKFTMLLSAGLSVRNAWERIVVLNRGKEGFHPAYEEMSISLRQIQQGVSELEVYEKFGIRTGQVHYKKLMALFILDKKRGSINLLDAMNQEMLQAFEEQKRKTRQQGEKTGTKLLLPMMGMLAIVFVMILVPAFLSFQL